MILGKKQNFTLLSYQIIIKSPFIHFLLMFCNDSSDYKFPNACMCLYSVYYRFFSVSISIYTNLYMCVCMFRCVYACIYQIYTYIIYMYHYTHINIYTLSYTYNFLNIIKQDIIH